MTQRAPGGLCPDLATERPQDPQARCVLTSQAGRPGTRTRARLNRTQSLQPQGPQVDRLGPATWATRGPVTAEHKPLVLATCCALGRGVPTPAPRQSTGTPLGRGPASGLSPAVCSPNPGRADKVGAATRHGAWPQPSVLPRLRRASPRQQVCLGSGVLVVTSVEQSPRCSPVMHLSQERWSQEGLSRSHGCDRPPESHRVMGHTRASVLRGSRLDRQVAQRLSAWWEPAGLPCQPGQRLSSFPPRTPTPLGASLATCTVGAGSRHGPPREPPAVTHLAGRHPVSTRCQLGASK